MRPVARLNSPENCFPENSVFLFAAGFMAFLFAGACWGAAPGCIGFAAVDGDNSIGMSIFGGTTGGNGGTTVTVSTQSALEAALGQAGPQVIQVQGLITISPLGKTEDIPSNTTLIGTGCNSGILNGHLVLDGVSNVIVQDLSIGDSYVPGDPAGSCCNWDGLTIWHSPHHIWIDHCDFSHTNDGLCDITDQANYVTVSWCHFHDHNKVSLVGSSDSTTVDANYLTTWCWAPPTSASAWPISSIITTAMSASIAPGTPWRERWCWRTIITA